jgi:hypothetical protein
MPKVAKNETNLKKCPCPECPSYNECAGGKKEVLYCAEEIGKSACDYAMEGCICGPCPVHVENNLLSGYYCIGGSAEEVDGK